LRIAHGNEIYMQFLDIGEKYALFCNLVFKMKKHYYFSLKCSFHWNWFEVVC
jgi:hypothetical protein